MVECDLWYSQFTVNDENEQTNKQAKINKNREIKNWFVFEQISHFLFMKHINNLFILQNKLHKLKRKFIRIKNANG